MYLTFGVLIAGMSFIGWRVVRGVRARDAVVNNIAGTSGTPGTPGTPS